MNAGERRRRITHVAFTDAGGGAAIAARRLHTALLVADVDSVLAVARRATDAPGVVALRTAADDLVGKICHRLVHSVVAKAAPGVPCSLALFPSAAAARVGDLRADVVHLHWVCGEMLSVAQIGRLPRPLVWTLHDSWAFSGMWHLPADAAAGPLAFHLDRWTAARKRRHWRRPIELVCPSQWLADQARRSELCRGWPVRVLPNALDTTAFAPRPRPVARRLLGLPPDRPLVLFAGGMADRNKGGDLLQAALVLVRERIPGVAVAVLGPADAGAGWAVPVHALGRLDDEATLSAAYAAANVVAVPSRSESLSYVAIEAQACGTPVAGFAVGGLPEAIARGPVETLAPPFDVARLADVVARLLADSGVAAPAGAAAREFATRFDLRRVARQHLSLYEELLAAG